jgi:hypothetical protein
MLAELMLSRHVSVQHGHLHRGGAEQPPADRLLAELLASVELARHDGDVATWVRFLAAEAGDDIRHRLTADGALVAASSRTRVGRRWRTVYLPADPNAAVWPAIRLAKHLSAGLPMTLADKVVTCLVAAMGLLDHVLWLKPDHEPGRERARTLRQELPGGLGELVAHVDAEVGQGVLAGRSG